MEGVWGNREVHPAKLDHAVRLRLRRSHDDFKAFGFYHQRLCTESGKARLGGGELMDDLSLLDVILDCEEERLVLGELGHHAFR